MKFLRVWQHFALLVNSFFFFWFQKFRAGVLSVNLILTGSKSMRRSRNKRLRNSNVSRNTHKRLRNVGRISPSNIGRISSSNVGRSEIQRASSSSLPLTRTSQRSASERANQSRSRAWWVNAALYKCIKQSVSIQSESTRHCINVKL